MPRVETAAYATERQKWETKPQVIVRFVHVPTNELLIPTSTQTVPIGDNGMETVAGAVFRPLRGAATADSYEYAQQFLIQQPLSPNATFEVHLFLRKVGSPAAGTLTISIMEMDFTSTVLNGTATLPVSGVTNTSTGQWLPFVWGNLAKPILEPWRQYLIVVRPSYAINLSNNIEIARTPTDAGGYPWGQAMINTQAAPNGWVFTDADLLFRLRESITTVIGGVQATAVPFSRDFSSGPVTSPLRSIFECIEDVNGNTQTVVPHLAQSSTGNLTLELTDVGGEALRYIGALPMRVAEMSATSPAPGDFLIINEPNSLVAALPTMGTFEVITGGVIERIRYTNRDATNSRLTVLGRGVDGTVAAAHGLNDLGANGEAIRPGQRVALFLGYEGLPQSEAMLYGVWEVVGRRCVGASVHVQLTDMQFHLRKTVALNATPDIPYRGRTNPIDSALMFLMSTGTGVNGAYDVLFADQGMGVPQQFVDVAAFQALKASDFPDDIFDWHITGPTDAKEFLVEQIYKPLGCYPYITQRGQISIRKFQSAPAPASVPDELVEDDIIDFEGQYDGVILNEFAVEYDYDLETRPHDFGKRVIYTVDSSLRQFGRRAPWTLRSFGLKTADGAEAMISKVLLRIAQRYGTTSPPPMFKVRVPYRRHERDIGDLVKLTHSKIPHAGGYRGVVQAVCEIQDITPMFLARSGGLQLTLMYVGGLPTLVGGFDGLPVVLAPTPPPPPSGLELVIDGVGQGNSPYFWGRNISVRWNAVGPIDNQEALGGDAMAQGLHVDGYWGQLYSPDAVTGQMVLRREGLTRDTSATYTYEANAADHGGTPSRHIMVRLRTQLVGGIRSAQSTEMEFVNLPPDMTGFLPQIIEGQGVALINWGAWPQTDLDLEKYRILYAASYDADWVPGMDPNKEVGFVAHPSVTYTAVIPYSGVTYRIRIQPWDVFGAGQASDIIEWNVPTGTGVDVTPPAAPTGLSTATGVFTTADGRQATFAWASWNRNTEPDIASYVLIYRQLGTIPWSWQVALHYPVTGPTMTVSAEATLPAATTFEFQVAAIDLSGNQSAFAPPVPIQLPIAGLTAPPAPTGLAVSTGTTIVDGRKVTWAEASWDRITTPGIAAYVLRYRQLGVTAWSTQGTHPQPPSGATVSTRAEAELPQTMTFEFQVCSVDLQGNQSGFAPVTPVQLPIAGGVAPATPTGLALSTGVESTVAQDGSYLAWVQATWIRNTEADMLQYNVQGRLVGAPTWQPSGVVEQTPSGDPVIRWNGLAPGMNGEVRVQAEDRDGHQSAWSAAMSIIGAVFATAPSAPGTPTVTAGPTSLRITWPALAIPDLAYYEVHEGTAAGFAISGTGAIGSGTCIAHEGAATHVRNFPVGTTYPITRHYRIVAVRSSGDRSAASPSASGTASAVATADVQDANVTTIKLATGAVSQLIYTGATPSFTLIEGTYVTIYSQTVTLSGGVVEVIAACAAVFGSLSGTGTGIETVLARVRNSTTGNTSPAMAVSLPNGTINATITLQPIFQQIPPAGVNTFVLEMVKQLTSPAGKVVVTGVGFGMAIKEMLR